MAHALFIGRWIGLLVLIGLASGGRFGTSAIVDAPSVAAQATFEVINSNDSGFGSLRQAILDAAAGDTIIFADGVTTVTLTSDQLTIDKDLTIDGGDGVTVERSSDASTPDFRIFAISGSDTEVMLDSLTIHNGHATSDDGGGILHTGGTLTVMNSTLSGSTASFDGGGIANTGGTLTLMNSTLSDNTANDDGGGIANAGGTLTVMNSTLSDNTANDDGGGIVNTLGGTLTLIHSTMIGNQASYTAGGIVNFEGDVTLANTIVAQSEGAGADYSGGTPTTHGTNIVGDGSVSGALTGDPQLGPLHDNGGPTLTHLPQTGSPAIGAGVNSVATNAGITTDQRGFARLVGGTIDIGAVEVQPTCFTQARDASDAVLAPIFAHGSAQAFRAALAMPNVVTVRVAGFCGGATVAGGGVNNVASINTTVTVQGGYPVDFDTSTPDFNVVPDPAAYETVLSGQGAGRVLFIDSSGDVTLDGLTIRYGVAGSGNGGGGIINEGGTLAVANSNISDNYAAGSGGGILNKGGTLAVANSTFSNNRTGAGGGIANAGGGETTVANSTFSGNYVADGGGIINQGGKVAVTNSTISGNIANSGGGGIVNGGFMIVTNSTISGNIVSDNGGGIFNVASGLVVTNSTISGNTAGASGGGIFIHSDSEVKLANTMVANNMDGSGENDVHNMSTLTALGANIVESSVSGTAPDTTSGTIAYVDPLLGPLADNGGPTLTHLPQTGSPAINAGDNGMVDGTAPPVDFNGDGTIDATDTLDTDQRGRTRLVGTADIGAVEVSALVCLPCITR